MFSLNVRLVLLITIVVILHKDINLTKGTFPQISLRTLKHDIIFIRYNISVQITIGLLMYISNAHL